MKYFTTIVLFLFFGFASFAQTSTEDIDYLKATNNLWGVSSFFKEIANAQDMKTERDKKLKLIEPFVASTKKQLERLKSKYPNDVDVETLSLWIGAFETSLESLKSNNWKVDPVWQLGFSLIELDLVDFTKDKLSN